jgi:hypothetical protein
LHERALALRRRFLSPDDRKTLNSYFLGDAYEKTGRLADAPKAKTPDKEKQP